jgi:hypothetical protein
MKLKEQLVQYGLTEEKAQEFIDKNIDGVFIPKARFDEVNEENKGLKSQIADRDTQLEQLKKSSGDNADLKAQIEKLQGENKTQKEGYEAQIAQIRLDNAVDSALTAAGAKNNKAVKAMLDMTGVKLDKEGNLTGLKEQLDGVKKSDSYMFNAAGSAGFKGAKPGDGGDGNPGGVDTSKMTYSEMAAYLAENPGAEI